MKLRSFSGKLPGVTGDDNSATRSVILSKMEAACPLLNYAEFYPMVGSADTAVTEAGATGGNMRALNASFSDQTTDVDMTSVELRIFGDTVRTDDELVARGYDPNGEHLRQLASFATAMGRDLFNRFINDSFGATTFSGIKEMSASTGSISVLFDSAGDGTVPQGNTTSNVTQRQKMIEALENLIGSVSDANCLIMDTKTRARIKAIARDYFSTANIADVYGSPIQIETILGVPIINAGYKKNNSDLVIPHDETDGSRTGATSIYAVRYGEKQDLTYATNIGVRVDGPTKVKNFIETLVQLSIGTMLVNPKAIGRLKGIKIT